MTDNEWDLTDTPAKATVPTRGYVVNSGLDDFGYLMLPFALFAVLVFLAMVAGFVCFLAGL